MMHPAMPDAMHSASTEHVPDAKHVRTNELTDVDTSKTESGSCVGNAHEQTPFYVDESVTLWHGDCLDVMRTLPDASVDAVVCDPPYGLGFMGREWDDLPPGLPWARECLRVLKPGGWLLAFGGARTWHRLAVAVEDAGFEMHESLAWLHGQGFPKHKGHLKPAFEPVVRGRKKGTRPSWLNIDACRIGTSKAVPSSPSTPRAEVYGFGANEAQADRGGMNPNIGRWPTNVLLDGSQADALDEQSGTLRSPGSYDYGTPDTGNERIYGNGLGVPKLERREGYADSGGASRFFPVFRYGAKADSAERPRVDGVAHPTVKPLALMRWLVRLVTPPGGTVLEPFAGSGTTAEACVIEGFRCIAIEREATYLPLIVARLSKPIQVDLFGGAA